MSNIKKYIIDYDWKASIEIEIDHDVMTEEKLHQINNFWSDSEYRLNKHGSLLNEPPRKSWRLNSLRKR